MKSKKEQQKSCIDCGDSFFTGWNRTRCYSCSDKHIDKMKMERQRIRRKNKKLLTS